MRSLTLEPYGARAFMATGPSSWRALRRKLSFLDVDPPTSAGRCDFALFCPDNGGIPTPVCVIYIDVDQHAGDAGQLVDTCAHEATHAASQLFDHIGHYPQGVDEPSAYLIGALSRWLWEGIE